MKTFFIVWLGQLLSTLGTGITGFAVGVWVFQQNGSATEFALISFSVMLPSIVISPFAGVLADKMKRKTLILMADTGAALATLTLFLLITYGELEVWHIYATTLARASFNALQLPAYMAAVTMLVSKKQLGRAGGMTQLSAALSRLLAPALGGFLLLGMGLNAIFILDLVTYGFALLTLIFTAIPDPKREDKPQKKSEGNALTFGWRYIRDKDGLMPLLLFFCLSNFLMGLMLVLAQPMILSFADAQVLGTVMSLAALGMVVGSLSLSIWGGPKNLVAGIFGFQLLTATGIFIAGLQASSALITLGAFLFFVGVPITLGCNQALWQKVIPPEYQGRVFGMRRTIAGALMPAAFLAGGPMADYLFEPWMAEGGALASVFGPLIGVGPGRGIALLFSLLGVMMVLLTTLGYMLPSVRKLAESVKDAECDNIATDFEQQLEAKNSQLQDEVISTKKGGF